MLSIVIPTYNEAPAIGALVTLLRDAAIAGEIIVADGGSTDGTLEAAADSGARTVSGPASRGAQMAAGAAAATGSWLLFLHADTRPGPGWVTAVERFMADPENRFRAGYFRYVLDDPSPAARRLEKLVQWRCQWLNLPYGDQGLLIGAAYYDRLGGFPEIPLMEDVALVRRIPRHRLAELAAVAVTSAARYRRDGYVARPARNLFCLCLYYLGFPPGYLKTLYR